MSTAAQPAFSPEAPMGKVEVELYLENQTDRDQNPGAPVADSSIRHVTVKGIVDTGALMLTLPEDIVARLGLLKRREVNARYADGRSEVRGVYGTVGVHYGNRSTQVSCVSMPVGCHMLVGQVPLEEMDLIVDCKQRLVPRPESPDLPLIELY